MVFDFFGKKSKIIRRESIDFLKKNSKKNKINFFIACSILKHFKTLKSTLAPKSLILFTKIYYKLTEFKPILAF